MIRIKYNVTSQVAMERQRVVSSEQLGSSSGTMGSGWGCVDALDRFFAKRKVLSYIPHRGLL